MTNSHDIFKDAEGPGGIVAAAFAALPPVDFEDLSQKRPAIEAAGARRAKILGSIGNGFAVFDTLTLNEQALAYLYNTMRIYSACIEPTITGFLLACEDEDAERIREYATSLMQWLAMRRTPVMLEKCDHTETPLALLERWEPWKMQLSLMDKVKIADIRTGAHGLAWLAKRRHHLEAWRKADKILAATYLARLNTVNARLRFLHKASGANSAYSPLKCAVCYEVGEENGRPHLHVLLYREDGTRFAKHLSEVIWRDLYAWHQTDKGRWYRQQAPKATGKKAFDWTDLGITYALDVKSRPGVVNYLTQAANADKVTKATNYSTKNGGAVHHRDTRGALARSMTHLFRDDDAPKRAWRRDDWDEAQADLRAMNIIPEKADWPEAISDTNGLILLQAVLEVDGQHYPFAQHRYVKRQAAWRWQVETFWTDTATGKPYTLDDIARSRSLQQAQREGRLQQKALDIFRASRNRATFCNSGRVREALERFPKYRRAPEGRDVVMIFHEPLRQREMEEIERTLEECEALHFAEFSADVDKEAFGIFSLHWRALAGEIEPDTGKAENGFERLWQHTSHHEYNAFAALV